MRLNLALGAALMVLSASGAAAEDYVNFDEVPSCVVGEDANGVRPQLLDVRPRPLRVSFPRKEGSLWRPHYRNFRIRP